MAKSGKKRAEAESSLPVWENYDRFEYPDIERYVIAYDNHAYTLRFSRKSRYSYRVKLLAFANGQVVLLCSGSVYCRKEGFQMAYAFVPVPREQWKKVNFKYIDDGVELNETRVRGQFPTDFKRVPLRERAPKDARPVRHQKSRLQQFFSQDLLRRRLGDEQNPFD